VELEGEKGLSACSSALSRFCCGLGFIDELERERQPSASHDHHAALQHLFLDHNHDDDGSYHDVNFNLCNINFYFDEFINKHDILAKFKFHL